MNKAIQSLIGVFVFLLIYFISNSMWEEMISMFVFSFWSGGIVLLTGKYE